MADNRHLTVRSEVLAALEAGKAVVTLESTVISHGLPRPTNLDVARQCEAAIRAAGAVPATVGIIGGQIVVGLDDDQLELLAMHENVRKVSRRDFGIALARKEHGATTVAGTMIAAHMAGIRLFATGGIGGVHRGDTGDVSADLPELARTPVAVVCAGVKSILDLPRTLEYLETMGVPVIGWQTEEVPAFYARSSGLPVDICVNTAQDAAAVLRAKWSLGLEGGALIAVPPPDDLALDLDEMEEAVEEALQAADEAGVTGKDITPFLLSRVSEITGGDSLEANIALLVQNARVAAEIAQAMTEN
jgi:pseudouridine-5'-phosphate glycosidase